MKIKQAKHNSEPKVVNNKSIVEDILCKAQDDFINGSHISEINVTEIQTVIERIFNVNDKEQYIDALSVVEGVMDEFMDWLYAHCDDNGYYAEKVRYGGYIKSDRQLNRDLKDSGRKGHNGIWKQTDLFCQHRYTDNEGNEYYDFEGNNELTKSQIEDDIVAGILQEEFIQTLTEEEREILFYRFQGKTLEECAALTGFTYKQVRGRQEKYRQKQQEFYNSL